MNRNGSLAEALTALPWFHLVSYLSAACSFCLAFMLTLDSLFARVPGLFLVTGTMATIGWGFFRLPSRFRKMSDGYSGNVVDALPGAVLSVCAQAVMFRDFQAYFFEAARSGTVSLSLLFCVGLSYVGLLMSAIWMRRVPEQEFRYGVEEGDLFDLGVGYLVFALGAGLSLALSPFGEAYQTVAIAGMAIPVVVAVALLYVLPRTLDEDVLERIFADGEVLTEYGTAKGMLLLAVPFLFLACLVVSAWTPGRPTLPIEGLAMMAAVFGAICSLLGVALMFRDGADMICAEE